MAWRRPGDKPLSESMMVSLLTHICVTRPQWVNSLVIRRAYDCDIMQICGTRIVMSSWLIVLGVSLWTKCWAEIDIHLSISCMNITIWYSTNVDRNIVICNTIYHQTSNIRHTKSLNLSSCSCHCPIHWNQVLSQEWRCSWRSANRRCSNYIWVINNFIA